MNAPKRDNSTGFQFVMLDSDRPEQAVNDGVMTDAKPPCVALVPMVSSAQWSPIPPLSRANSTFVTQLIATAEYLPQTRSLRRATAADAQTAYQANLRPIEGAGIRTRQII